MDKALGPQLSVMGGTVKGVTVSIDQLAEAFPKLVKKDLTEVGAYSAVSWVYRCVGIRGDTLAGLPRAFFRGEKQLDDIPDLWADVDLDWLLWRTEAARCIWGASFWEKDATLHWINPSTITIEYTDGKIAKFIQSKRGGEPVPFGPDELVYLPLWNPQDDLGKGVSPATVALSAAGLARYLQIWPEKFFSQGAIPAIILTTDRTIQDDDPEVKRLKAWWKRLFGGIERSWETAVLGKGLEPKVIGQPVKDLVIPELSRQVREDIAATFGIPITMLQQAAANYATAREDRQGYYKETLFPEAKQIAAGANRQLFGPAGYELRFLFGEVEAIQQDEAEKAAGIADLMEQAQKQYEGDILTRERTVFLVEDLWGQMGIEFPEEMKDEEPERSEPETEGGSIGREVAAGMAPMAPEMVQAQEAMQQAASNLRKDLRRWRRKVKSRGRPADFESEWIPDDMYQGIALKLAIAEDDEERAEAFDPPFF